jgi:hypothetical protein
MMLIGLLATRYGLLAPMLAHTVTDIILFEQLVRTYRNLPKEDVWT